MMSVNLDELQQALPNAKATGEVPCVLYSIDDDLFGLTEKQKELRPIAADFAQKNVVRKDLLELSEKYINHCEKKEKQASPASTPTSSNEDTDYFRELFDEKVEKTDETKKKREIFEGLGKLGLLGITVKKDYGGQEGSLIDSLIVMEELSRAFIITALQYNLHDNHCIYPIDHFGTNAQKQKYLPKLCSGEFVGIVALSTSKDKSELKNLQAENQGDYFILNGVATTDGSIGDIIITYATTNRNIDFGVTAFIVENSFQGFIREDNSNQIVFDNCKVPAKNMLGEKNKGQMILFSCSDIEKVALAGGAVGFMQGFCNAAFKYAHTSSKFYECKDKIAKMYTKLRACESYLYTMARFYDNGYFNPKDSSAVVIYCCKNVLILASDYQVVIENNKRLSIDGQGLLLLSTLNFIEEQGNIDEHQSIVTLMITKEYTCGSSRGNFN